MGYTDLRGQQWVDFVQMNVFLSVYSGHLQSHLERSHTLISSLLYPRSPLLFSTPSPQPLDHWRHFHIVPNGSKYSQVMFTLLDGAQTLSRFCLFAVLYFIVFVIIIIIVVVVF